MDQPEVVSALSWLGWLELIKRIGGFMVIAGVAIEVGGEWISGPFHKIVEDARQLELSTLNNEAARLSSEAATARGDIAKANAETAKANEVAAKANERAAELKLALEKEVAARQPRRITDAQRAKIVEILKPVAEKGPVSVSWKLFDEEAVQFGQDVLAALQAAGFDAKEERGPMSFGVPGQWVIVPDDSCLAGQRILVRYKQHLRRPPGFCLTGEQNLRT
jgi:hypothetical protein